MDFRKITIKQGQKFDTIFYSILADGDFHRINPSI